MNSRGITRRFLNKSTQQGKWGGHSCPPQLADRNVRPTFPIVGSYLVPRRRPSCLLICSSSPKRWERSDGRGCSLHNRHVCPLHDRQPAFEVFAGKQPRQVCILLH